MGQTGQCCEDETSAALYILEADKVFVTLADGTSNALTNGGSFVAIDDINIDGALFSKQDLTFNGTGSLTVTSPAGHGIVCKDDLVFTSGTYTVNSASHGIDANDSVRIADANITIDAGKDAIHCENSDDATKGFTGTQIVLKDKDGNTVLEHTPELNFAVVILSSPDLVKGETYTITVGSQSGEFEAS